MMIEKLFMILLGGSLAISSVVMFIFRIRSCTQKIEAVCTNTGMRLSGTKGKSFHPTYTFTLEDVEHSVKTTSVLGQKPAVGDTCELYVNPQNPKTFFDSAFIFNSFIIFFLGLFFILFPFI